MLDVNVPLSLVGPVVLALVSAIGILFWQLIGSKDASVKREQATTDKLLGMLDRLIPAVEEQKRQIQILVDLVKTWMHERPG